jgi:hypothetical protein
MGKERKQDSDDPDARGNIVILPLGASELEPDRPVCRVGSVELFKTAGFHRFFTVFFYALLGY